MASLIPLRISQVLTGQAVVYTSVAFTDRLAEAGIQPSVSSVGGALDIALAEFQIGLCKSELVWPHGPWRDRDHLEVAVLDWVTWFNTDRATIRLCSPRLVDNVAGSSRPADVLTRGVRRRE